MSAAFLNALEVMTNGLMAGVLYALVALGFVLIYKASGIFNYAQGVMALFAALTLVGIMEGQVPFSHLINAIFGTDIHHFGWHLPGLVAIIMTLAIMVPGSCSASSSSIWSGRSRSSSLWRPSVWPISWRASAI